ncbi:MAG: serine/threonine-protein phosphatase [Bacteroidaceae bacterium]|nr:serine/threonine-protein phosphatase [Bacteroidaceae bacterium]
MIFQLDAISDIGPTRPRNEDMILIGDHLLRDNRYTSQYAVTDSDHHVIALADGMGGHNAGDIASHETLQSLSKFIRLLPNGLTATDLSLSLNQWVLQMHVHLGTMGFENTDYYGMGTTLVGILFYEGNSYWFNCGDSRLYRLSGEELQQLSSDHSLSWLTGRPSAPGNVIVNCIGSPSGSPVFIDFEPITPSLTVGDQLLLCSDGLTDSVPSSHLTRFLTADWGAEQLIKAACLMGAKDNISVCKVNIVG